MDQASIRFILEVRTQTKVRLTCVYLLAVRWEMLLVARTHCELFYLVDQQLTRHDFHQHWSKTNSLFFICLLREVSTNITSLIEEENLELDVVLGTALVDTYAKCGFLDEAMDIFDRMKDKDVKSWTAMISGHGVHGQPTNAIRLFNRMENEGFRPNEVTFLAILTACSHGGLVNEGMKIFKCMIQEYGFSPQVEHYGCLIDLLGRAGMLHEAHRLIKSLPTKGDATAWRTLLSACRVYGDVKLGECVKDVLSNIYTAHPTDSLLISSTYAVAGRISDLTRVQEMKQTNVTLENYDVRETVGESMIKEAGFSRVEIDSLG